MANLNDVRRIALSLPGGEAARNGFAFSVRNGKKDKAFAWVWNERVEPKKPRVPNPKVLAVRVHDLTEKEVVLESNKRKFFTEPHYDGFPAVLVRLREVRVGELRELLKTAWKIQAPRTLVNNFGNQDGQKQARR